MKLKPFYEIFHQTNGQKALTIDQMRFNTTIKSQFNKNINLELGYIKLMKSSSVLHYLQSENNFIVNISYHF